MTRIPVLAGPTASGKTALSLELARRFPLEIVSADAMMVYRGMDIGTAKPTPEERTRVPHHLVDILEPNTDFSVAQWVAAAETVIGDILERGKIPFVVGGTGFYIRALSQGVPSTPPSDPDAIARLEVELRQQGLDAMLAELSDASPNDASRAERNPRRVLRALEILRGTGHPPSSFAPKPPRFKFTKIVLLPDRAELETCIAARTQAMLEGGLLEETRALTAVFSKGGRRATSFQAIGYKQALDHLLGVTDDAEVTHAITLEETERRINLATRQYAKRQETWFKAEPDATIERTLQGARSRLEALLARW
ncbi:MAG: tRNA (adenosine(37)-N6)-dimethylallyltransferase MiaA [Pleurocapsa sp. SU_196_0]|nr:tRNA (adenosine(37)-N6)-dimethylallyltransferase MiaA [Pleurocapsa sp. SU_196_0]